MKPLPTYLFQKKTNKNWKQRKNIFLFLLYLSLNSIEKIYFKRKTNRIIFFPNIINIQKQKKNLCYLLTDVQSICGSHAIIICVVKACHSIRHFKIAIKYNCFFFLYSTMLLNSGEINVTEIESNSKSDSIQSANITINWKKSEECALQKKWRGVMYFGFSIFCSLISCINLADVKINNS